MLYTNENKTYILGVFYVMFDVLFVSVLCVVPYVAPYLWNVHFLLTLRLSFTFDFNFPCR